MLEILQRKAGFMAFIFDPSQLVANMDAIRNRVAVNGKRRAVRAGAQVIGAAMIERTPMLAAKTNGSDSLDPGEMKDNIKVRDRTEDGEPVALVGVAGQRAGKAAHNVEYGHRMVHGGESRLDGAGKFVGGGIVHEVDVPPHAFLRPAFEASAAEALGQVGIVLGEELQKGAQNV